MTETMTFVGVSTAGSSIMDLFPRWAAELGLDAELVGLDLPLDATPDRYRAALEALRDDPRNRGALVTTHKVALLEAGRDLFAALDPYAERLGEVSSIARRAEGLVGHAKDPITAGLALAPVLAGDHFARTGGHALVLGAGGAGAAIVLALLSRPDPPARVVVTDVAAARLAAVARLGAVETAGTGEAGALCAALPPGSLVVNATGLGKDRPGSPLPAGTPFPRDGVAWELNYRGALDFLHAARAQAADRGLRVEDGWLYFLHGWSAVIAEVFELDLTPARFDRLRVVADATR